jgi:DNA-binding NarL/FixJ family response regulator
MPSSNVLRILIADDHRLIRRGVRDLLSPEPGWQIIAEACDGAEALRMTLDLKPDLAILDFSMPHMNGPQVTRELGRVCSATRIIILTMHDSDEVIRDVLQAGARGFVLKSDADQVLLAAIDAVANDGYFVTSQRGEMLLQEYLESKSSQVKGETEARITQREQEVMALLASGMTSREIASRLGISTRTAESHRLNINRKLSFKSIADLVRHAIRYDIVATL